MKLKCPLCSLKVKVEEKPSPELANHIFVNHWHEIRRKKKRQDQEKFRAETKREKEKEKKKRNWE